MVLLGVYVVRLFDYLYSSGNGSEYYKEVSKRWLLLVFLIFYPAILNWSGALILKVKIAFFENINNFFFQI